MNAAIWDQNICRTNSNFFFVAVAQNNLYIFNIEYFHWNLLTVIERAIENKIAYKLQHCCSNGILLEAREKYEKLINFNLTDFIWNAKKKTNNQSLLVWWSFAIISRQFWFYTLLTLFKWIGHLYVVNQTANGTCTRSFHSTTIIINHWTCVNLMRFHLFVIFLYIFFFHWLIALSAAIQCSNSITDGLFRCLFFGNFSQNNLWTNRWIWC